VVADGLAITRGSAREPYRVLRADGTGGVAIYLIEHAGFFDRDGIYGEREIYPTIPPLYLFRTRRHECAELIRPTCCMPTIGMRRRDDRDRADAAPAGKIHLDAFNSRSITWRSRESSRDEYPLLESIRRGSGANTSSSLATPI